MAIHTLTDMFAHSAYVWDKADHRWVHLVHTPENAYHNNPNYSVADKTGRYPERWEDARRAVYGAMCQYEKTAHPAGTYNEFRYVQDSDSYRLGNIYENVMAVAGTAAATKFLGSNYSTK